jgi:hypothetical protein
MSPLIVPFANPIFNLVFGSFSEISDFLDRVSLEVRADMEGTSNSDTYRRYNASIILPSAVAALEPKSKVVAVCNVHHNASAMFVICEFTSERSAP